MLRIIGLISSRCDIANRALPHRDEERAVTYQDGRGEGSERFLDSDSLFFANGARSDPNRPSVSPCTRDALGRTDRRSRHIHSARETVLAAFSASSCAHFTQNGPHDDSRFQIYLPIPPI